VKGVHYPFDRVSSQHRCSECGKPIKERLVVQKETPPKLCYAHWKARRKLGVRAAGPT
jgi:hypothetical protein